MLLQFYYPRNDRFVVGTSNSYEDYEEYNYV